MQGEKARKQARVELNLQSVYSEDWVLCTLHASIIYPELTSLTGNQGVAE